MNSRAAENYWMTGVEKRDHVERNFIYLYFLLDEYVCFFGCFWLLVRGYLYELASY